MSAHHSPRLRPLRHHHFRRAWAQREALLVVVAAASVGLILYTFNAQYPVQEWVLFRVAQYWCAAGYWALGCASSGVALLSAITKCGYRCSERILVGFALGVLLFAGTTFVVGLGGQLGQGYFFSCPGILFLLGARDLSREVRQAWERTPWRKRRPVSLLSVLALVFGGICVLAVYLPILTTHNVQHDARWYHLPIAQQYASSGAIEPFREGWFLAAYPHLSSILYAWALLCPVSVVHRIGIAAHMEFVVFLATVASVPIVLRRLLPRQSAPGTWAGLFLFPGLFVYDSNLSLGADHIAALWAGPVLIVLLQALPRLGWKHCCLLGGLVGGAAWTKYSAVCLVGPVFLVFGVRCAFGAASRARRARGATAFVVAFAVTWAPHWLKNWIWYGDPLYPYLNRHLPSAPWSARAAAHFSAFLEHDVLGPAPGLSGAIEGVATALTLGFQVHEYDFHGKIPTFGFLFAVCFACLPFVRTNRRVCCVFGLGLLGVLFWYWTNHRDRYLQAIVPWLTCATVSVLLTVWRSNAPLARLSVGALVGVQVTCGLGVFFIQSHIMIPGKHPLGHVQSLVDAGYKGHFKGRFDPYPDWGFSSWVALGKKIKRPAKVLVHEERLWVGLDAPVVVDEPAWQAGIDYARVGNPEDIRNLLKQLGVSHIVTGHNHPGGGDHHVLGELNFWEFVADHCEMVAANGRLTLWRAPHHPIPVRKETHVFVSVCAPTIPRSLYEFGPAGVRDVESANSARDGSVSGAHLAVSESGCIDSADLLALASHRVLATRGAITFWARRK